MNCVKVYTKLPRPTPSAHPPSEPFLAIGNFDGLHVGHRALIGRLVRSARKAGRPAAVLTFVKHPRLVLKPHTKLPLLSSGMEKLSDLNELGVNACYLLPFTKRFSMLSPEAFVRDILVRHFRIHTLYMGHNARFGHARKGTVRTMARLAKRYGFAFHAVLPSKQGGRIVNSTRVRRLISTGRLDEAQKALARYPLITGKVVRGSSRGRRLGFPTANLKVLSGVLPPLGVYAVHVAQIRYRTTSAKQGNSLQVRQETMGRELSGLLNLGQRPTFKKGGNSINPVIPEVYLLNFRGSLYGKILKISVIKHLRKERKFKNASLLVAQIKNDVQNARKYL